MEVIIINIALAVSFQSIIKYETSQNVIFAFHILLQELNGTFTIVYLVKIIHHMIGSILI